MQVIKVYSLNPKSGWFFGQVIGRSGDSLTIRDLENQVIHKANVTEVREIKPIPLFSLVVPHEITSLTEWEIGIVLEMSHLDLSIGPVLKIRDIITGKKVKCLPHLVDRVIKDPRSQLASL